MKFTTEIQSYIKGEQFSNALKIPYSGLYPETGRIDTLLGLCLGKRVLHIGCADHLPLIHQKMQQGKWLHALLCETASECTGIDINEEAVKFITEKLHIKDVYHADITKSFPDELSDRNWDIVVMGEILEHVDNPVDFLSQLQQQLSHKASQLIITVPNSFNRLVMKDIQRNTEDINSDHMYHFTPYTLGRVLYKSGFSSPEFQFADRVALPCFQKITNTLKKLFRLKRQFKAGYFATLIAVTNFRKK